MAFFTKRRKTRSPKTIQSEPASSTRTDGVLAKLENSIQENEKEKLPSVIESDKSHSSDEPVDRAVHSIRFRTLASDRPNRDVVNDDEFEKSSCILREVMSPSRPVLDMDFFAGRTQELKRAISAIENEHMHLVIYGKRGWGKTSFTNTLTSIAKNAGYIVCRTSCSQSITYDGIFRSFLQQIPSIYDTSFILNSGTDSHIADFSQFLNDATLTPKELSEVLGRLSGTRVLFVLDEFDRSSSEELKYDIAETIKNFSDEGIRATIILVGVANTINDLLGIHESVQRNIAGIPMRLLSKAEFRELIDICENNTDMKFEEEALEKIEQLSRRVPHFSRIICLHAGQYALSQHRRTVSLEDVGYASAKARQELVPLLTKKNHILLETMSNQSARSFLRTIASVQTDDEGYFTIDDATQVFEELSGVRVTKLAIGSKLSLLSKQGNGLLTKDEEGGKVKYRMQDPLSGFFIRLSYEID